MPINLIQIQFDNPTLTLYQNGEILLVFLNSNKTLPLVIAHENLTRRHLVGKIYTKF